MLFPPSRSPGIYRHGKGPGEPPLFVYHRTQSIVLSAIACTVEVYHGGLCPMLSSLLCQRRPVSILVCCIYLVLLLYHVHPVVFCRTSLPHVP